MSGLHLLPFPLLTLTVFAISTNRDAPHYALFRHLLPLSPQYNPQHPIPQHPILQHPNLRYSCNARDQVLHPYKTRQN
jgi:hypothetical protein